MPAWRTGSWIVQKTFCLEHNNTRSSEKEQRLVSAWSRPGFDAPTTRSISSIRMGQQRRRSGYDGITGSRLGVDCRKLSSVAQQAVRFGIAYTSVSES